jgi:hypothetical protein
MSFCSSLRCGPAPFCTIRGDSTLDVFGAIALRSQLRTPRSRGVRRKGVCSSAAPVFTLEGRVGCCLTASRVPGPVLSAAAAMSDPSRPVWRGRLANPDAGCSLFPCHRGCGAASGRAALAARPAGTLRASSFAAAVESLHTAQWDAGTGDPRLTGGHHESTRVSRPR